MLQLVVSIYEFFVYEQAVVLEVHEFFVYEQAVVLEVQEALDLAAQEAQGGPAATALPAHPASLPAQAAQLLEPLEPLDSPPILEAQGQMHLLLPQVAAVAALEVETAMTMALMASIRTHSSLPVRPHHLLAQATLTQVGQAQRTQAKALKAHLPFRRRHHLLAQATPTQVGQAQRTQAKALKAHLPVRRRHRLLTQATPTEVVQAQRTQVKALKAQALRLRLLQAHPRGKALGTQTEPQEAMAVQAPLEAPHLATMAPTAQAATMAILAVPTLALNRAHHGLLAQAAMGRGMALMVAMNLSVARITVDRPESDFTFKLSAGYQLQNRGRPAKFLPGYWKQCIKD